MKWHMSVLSVLLLDHSTITFTPGAISTSSLPLNFSLSHAFTKSCGCIPGNSGGSQPLASHCCAISSHHMWNVLFCGIVRALCSLICTRYRLPASICCTKRNSMELAYSAVRIWSNFINHPPRCPLAELFCRQRYRFLPFCGPNPNPNHEQSRGQSR